MDEAGIAELFAALGPVRTRRMFGGRGVYRGERIVAIEVAGTVYLKADDATRPLLAAAGSEPFRYERGDGTIATMSYWRVPEAAYDDPDEAARWARLAGEAASRAQPPKRRARRRQTVG